MLYWPFRLDNVGSAAADRHALQMMSPPPSMTGRHVGASVAERGKVHGNRNPDAETQVHQTAEPDGYCPQIRDVSDGKARCLQLVLIDNILSRLTKY